MILLAVIAFLYIAGIMSILILGDVEGPVGWLALSVWFVVMPVVFASSFFARDEDGS